MAVACCITQLTHLNGVPAMDATKEGQFVQHFEFAWPPDPFRCGSLELWRSADHAC